MAGHAGNVDEAPAGTDEWKEGECGGQGAVVIALEGLLHNIGVYVCIVNVCDAAGR